MIAASRPTIGEIRAQFPALASGFAFMDNAGGSQVPGSVPDAIHAYMTSSYVQVGADYPASQRATQTVADAHGFVNTLMGGDRVGRTFFGASTSSLCRMLADAFADALKPGDEIIVGESGHEANVGPWASLAKRGLTVKIWPANPETGVCELAALKELLTERTKVVAFVQVSNILGHVEDVRPCIDLAHSVGARVVLDGVAYAPHLPIDVEAWGADWYVFSCYKVFGPHVGALFGRHEAVAELTGPNHYFLAKDYLPDKFELGGANHESCAGLLGTRSYLQWLAGHDTFSRQTVLDAWHLMEGLERPLTAQFLEFLAGKPKVRVIGRPTAGESRLPTIAFVHESIPTQEIANTALRAEVGMRYGSFYSVRLCERLSLDPGPGVARASFAHYNTSEEIDRLIAALDPIL